MKTAQPAALFDVPAITPAGDKARTRRSDPTTSHIAADISQANLAESKQRVLQIVKNHWPVTGVEVNELYATASRRHGWRRLAFDSPRKRLGELAEDGLVEVHDVRVAEGNHAPEASYVLTEAGRQALVRLGVSA